ncbi:Fur family transcriptional regulator [Curtobacterium sp. Leaf261]|uniref:Fur family transcriptional regulator n=1 Tax=Curtobacterium sp. Leaf261 TaxID=1736311 RepID=UPI000A7B8983
MTIDDMDVRALQTAGLRVTATRRAVLAATTRIPHAAVDQIVSAIQDDLPNTSPQAVYGVLGALTGAGLLRRIEPAGSAARYERRIGDNHHHVVCTVCGAIGDVDCAVGAAPCLTPSETNGFTVNTAEVTFWGLCAACAAADDDVLTDTVTA